MTDFLYVRILKGKIDFSTWIKNLKGKGKNSLIFAVCATDWSRHFRHLTVMSDVAGGI